VDNTGNQYIESYIRCLKVAQKWEAEAIFFCNIRKDVDSFKMAESTSKTTTRDRSLDSQTSSGSGSSSTSEEERLKKLFETCDDDGDGFLNRFVLFDLKSSKCTRFKVMLKTTIISCHCFVCVVFHINAYLEVQSKNRKKS